MHTPDKRKLNRAFTLIELLIVVTIIAILAGVSVPIFNTVKESGIKVHIYQYTTPMKPYIRGLKEVFKISRFFKSIDPDMIHSFHYAPDYSEPLAARLVGIKWIYTKKNMNWGGNSANGWRLRSWLANHILVQNKDMISEFFPKSCKMSSFPIVQLFALLNTPSYFVIDINVH